MTRFAAVVLVVLGTAACSEPLEFADWTIPTPEGTRIVGYRHIPDSERTEVLQLERDLVLAEAFGRPLYEPAGVAVAPDGRIFVLDSGNYRVVGFDAAGEPLVRFGRQGEGPGEFRTPENIALVGDKVVINDRMSSKFSVYSSDGVHVADHTLEERYTARAMLGSGADVLIIRDIDARYVPDNGVLPGEWSIGRYSPDGTELARLIELPYVWLAYWGRGVWSGMVPVRRMYVSGTVGGDGMAYVTAGEEYQVLALAADGTARFALRTNYEPTPIDEDRKREATVAAIEGFSAMLPDLSASDFVWPERHAAIDRLAVDGNGNLYVFPLIRQWGAPWPQPEGPYSVDVYSPDGERLFTGTMPIWRWDAVHDDSLYSIETDPESDEKVVARYRLLTPFE